MDIKNLAPSVWKKSDQALGRMDDNPFHALQREMNRAFDDFFHGFELSSFGAAEGRFGSFIPTLDMSESDKELNIQVELPGMDEKDVEVFLSEDTLTIKGEKKEEKEDTGKDYYHMERTYGSFNRVVALPQGIDREHAEARFKNGILYLTLPKLEPAKTKGNKIPIKAQ
jgi:HSP20 family protein